MNTLATQPAKSRSAKAKSAAAQATEADAVTEKTLPVTAMPPPTVKPHVMPQPTKPDPVIAIEPQSKAAPDPVSPFPQQTAPPPKADTPVPQNTEKRQGIFFPMLLGGLVAGGIGYGIAYTQFGQTDPVDLSGIEARIDDLEAQVANRPAPDTSAIDQVDQDMSALSSSIDERLAALDARIAQIGQQAPAIGEQAQEQAVAQLTDQIAGQQAELEQQRADLQAQLETTRAEAEQIKQNAVDTARNETARAALARVQGAIESGAPMQTALDDLAMTLTNPVPDALTAVSDGATTLATLRDTYPEASRNALSAARASGDAGDSASAMGSFLRNQLNVRSVAPRGGTSVDAVLSRAEDALRSGRLNDALAEIATLPESARAAMSDWISQAEARAAAVDAADQLDASLTAN